MIGRALKFGQNLCSSALNNRWKYQLHSHFRSPDIQGWKRRIFEYLTPGCSRTVIGTALKFGQKLRFLTLNNRWKFQLHSDFRSWDIKKNTKKSKKRTPGLLRPNGNRCGALVRIYVAVPLRIAENLRFIACLVLEIFKIVLMKKHESAPQRLYCRELRLRYNKWTKFDIDVIFLLLNSA